MSIFKSYDEMDDSHRLAYEMGKRDGVLSTPVATCSNCNGEGRKNDNRTDGNWTDGVCDWCKGFGVVLAVPMDGE